MAILNIAEFNGTGNVSPLTFNLPPVTTQNVTVGATSAQSAALNAQTRMVSLCADASCYIAVGVNPTAEAGSLYLPADCPTAFSVAGGHKIAVIAA
jgi:hypothetical protein